MQPARTLILAGLAATALACGGETSGPSAPGSPARAPLVPGKNLLLITLDTTRADYVSCLGGDPRNTPRLDELAQRSTLFHQATSETNVTNPSHVTIMTGLRAIEHEVHNNAVQIPRQLDTLAQAALRAGYQTAGFPATAHVSLAGWKGFEKLPTVTGGEWVGNSNTKRATEWLSRLEDRPFFLWIHYYDPHTIYEAPEGIAKEFYDGKRNKGEGPLIIKHPYFEQRMHAAADHVQRMAQWLGNTRDPEFGKAMYAAEIHYTDRQVGKLLDELETLGLADDTVVVVVADHGESLGEHGIYYDHNGLYEESIRIPLIVHVPGLAPSASDEQVSTLDVVPTVVDLLGFEMKHVITAGHSLVPLIEGKPEAFVGRDLQIFQNAHNSAVAVRRGPWKLIYPIQENHPVLPSHTLLFHLDDDPLEQNDLSAEHPERVAELAEIVRPWIQLGMVRAQGNPDLTEEQLQGLRALGYTDG